mgnify:FL=1
MLLHPYLLLYLFSNASSKMNLEPVVYDRENATSDEYIHSHQNLYSTIINSDPRCKPRTFFLVVVITTAKSFKHRAVYRDTVLSPIISNCLKDTKYMFLVGKPADVETQEKLEEENGQFQDMVQGDFIDSYENLTIKSLFLLKWASENCASAKYIFKLDDDVYAVLEDIRFHLKMNHVNFSPYTILGSIFNGAVPILDSKNKWHVKNFHEAVFPRYVSGTAYIISQKLLRPLFQAGVNLPFVRLEDVFVTGISARATKLDISYVAAPGFQYMNSVDNANLARTDFHSQRTIHGLDTEHIQFLHKKFASNVQSVCTTKS